MKTLKNIFNVIKDILTVILLLFLLVIITQKITNNKMNIFGMQVYTVSSGSMIPDYKIGDIIICKTVDPKTLEVGDDITYLGSSRQNNGLVITHRIVKIDTEKEENKIHFITKGLANEIEDPEITEDNVYGKVIYKTITLSFVSRLLKNQIAYYLIFVIVTAIVSIEVVGNYIIKDEEEVDENAKRRAKKAPKHKKIAKGNTKAK